MGLLPILFILLRIFLKQYQMQYIKEKAVAAVPSAPPLNPPMINLKDDLPFAPTCIPNKEVFSDFVTDSYGPGCSNLD